MSRLLVVFAVVATLIAMAAAQWGQMGNGMGYGMQGRPGMGYGMGNGMGYGMQGRPMGGYGMQYGGMNGGYGRGMMG